MRGGQRWLTWEVLLLAMLLSLIATGWGTSDVFFQGSTITLIITNIMEKALMALPMTLIIISGEIDLSVASTLGLVERGDRQDVGGRLAALALHRRGAGRWGALRVAQRRAGDEAGIAVAGRDARHARALPGTGLRRAGGSGGQRFPGGFASFGFKAIPGTRLPWTLLVFVPLLIVLLVLLHRSWLGRHLYAAGQQC